MSFIETINMYEEERLYRSSDHQYRINVQDEILVLYETFGGTVTEAKIIREEFSNYEKAILNSYIRIATEDGNFNEANKMLEHYGFKHWDKISLFNII